MDFGFILTSYHIFGMKQSESQYEMKFHIKQNNVIKWDTNDNSIYSGEFIDNGIIWELKRERKFVKDELIIINTEKYDVVVFDDTFEFTNLSKENANTLYNNFKQKSYYAKNKGLVKYERKFIDGTKNEWKLVQIFRNTNINEI